MAKELKFEQVLDSNFRVKGLFNSTLVKELIDTIPDSTMVVFSSDLAEGVNELIISYCMNKISGKEAKQKALLKYYNGVLRYSINGEPEIKDVIVHVRDNKIIGIQRCLALNVR